VPIPAPAIALCDACSSTLPRAEGSPQGFQRLALFRFARSPDKDAT
jgi:hypothetical protein